MAHQHPPLTPFPLPVLLGRISHEWASRKRIFDLPIARFFDASAGPDLTMEFLGRPAATPVGPAAGPHTQLTENIVLSWLSGARLMELKTVQILDELEIGRPCIDMETVGYNIEWSQELKIEQSLEEYVKAWMIIEILRGWDQLEPHIGSDPGPHIFDISVGYDLAGISSERVGAFIDGLIDASSSIDGFRDQIPEPFTQWRDHDFPTRIADTATLSTFHGCPPDEIESITKHLMNRHGLDVIVKLNPTLLGFERVGEIVNDVLGYSDVRLRRGDFEADLQFERGLELIVELERFAAENERRFGIKLTNTLVVENNRDFMPDNPMYLSGQPLHVVSTTLLGALDEALPGMLDVDGHRGSVQVSFSAGISKDNVADGAGLGLAPLTVCSDLLKPGGYGRMKPMIKALQNAITDAGDDSLTAWRRHRHEAAVAAGHSGAIAAYIASLYDPATNERYTREGTSKLPRSVDHSLEMWGCVACNLCVTVCPNDAFFRVPTPEGLEVDGRQQYFVFSELCNECGNCLTFCPEEGDPAEIKPRLYLDRGRFAAEAGSQAFLVQQANGGLEITATAGFEDEIERLHLVLDSEEGLPVRVGDLNPAAG